MKNENIMKIGKTFTADERREEKDIYCLEDGEEKFYSILGTGYGINFVHCFTMGAKNKENFWERAFAYKIIPNRDHADLLERATGDDYISVEFYELS